MSTLNNFFCTKEDNMDKFTESMYTLQIRNLEEQVRILTAEIKNINNKNLEVKKNMIEMLESMEDLWGYVEGLSYSMNNMLENSGDIEYGEDAFEDDDFDYDYDDLPF